MPSFCRHNRLLQNCPICSKEQAIELRPLVSSSAPRSTEPRPPSPRATAPRTRGPAGARTAPGVRVRRLARGADDGYRSNLVQGLKSSVEAERLAEELALATTRLLALREEPPGLYAEVANGDGDLEERTWLAFLIAYLCPLEADDPFAAIRPAVTSWYSEQVPVLDEVQTGPRSAHDPSRGTLDAYRAWARRAGSQAAAFIGESGWSPERRFARAFERLALPGLHRDARFDLLVALGWLGLYEMRAGALQLGGTNEVTVAAKRVFGIGDTMLLERRAADLARAADMPLEALDLGLYNWERGERITLGLGQAAEPDEQVLSSTHQVFGLD